ncbi:MAG: D-aminoacylase [Candidatus Moranbacteria bacterium]|nr:D-aminoacylase [Candidatus Moranbacteria bacterium]
MLDIIIKNANIIDGTGMPAYRADIGIKEDEIKKIGALRDERASVEIDAEGKIVCPGFIDVNNHSDTYWRIFLDPHLESLIYQGITTIIGGNCGTSLAPLANPGTIDAIQKWVDVKKINVSWLKVKEFLAFLGEKKISPNFATLVGHATLRRGIIGDEVRSMVPKEIEALKKALEKSMKEGALGMSTGLIYSHARLAPYDELLALAKIVKKYDGVYATHIRSEQKEIVEAVEEALRIARDSGAKLQISHLKVIGEKNWPKMKDVLALIANAKEEGIDVTFDVYPYTATGSVLYSFLPAWISEGGKRIMLHRLKDPVIRAKVISEMRESEFDYSKIEIAISPLNKTLARHSISEIALSQEKSVEDAVIDILIASEGMVVTSMEVLSEDNVQQAIASPLSFIATNGAGYDIFHAKTGERVHPRNFGSFIKVLEKYVKKERLLSWEVAINKMTQAPAEKFGLKNRGALKKGYFADIVMLDPDKLKSPATVENPYQYSKGVELVIINGEIVLSDGAYNGNRNGRVIKR